MNKSQTPTLYSLFPHLCAQFNLSLLKYVIPSFPHTGLYCGVVRHLSSHGDLAVPIPGIATVDVSALCVDVTALGVVTLEPK